MGRNHNFFCTPENFLCSTQLLLSSYEKSETKPEDILEFFSKNRDQLISYLFTNDIQPTDFEKNVIKKIETFLKQHPQPLINDSKALIKENPEQLEELLLTRLPFCGIPLCFELAVSLLSLVCNKKIFKDEDIAITGAALACYKIGCHYQNNIQNTFKPSKTLANQITKLQSWLSIYLNKQEMHNMIQTISTEIINSFSTTFQNRATHIITHPIQNSSFSTSK